MANHCGGLKSNGSAWCWGPNGGGQLGDNTWIDKSSPVAVVGNHSFTQIYVGLSEENYGSYLGWTCALKVDGSVWTWGYGGSYGQVQNSSSPVIVVGNHSFIKIAANTGFHVIGLKSNGSAWVWGSNVYGELGDNTKQNRDSPVTVVGNHSFVQIVASQWLSAALKADGAAWTWGYNVDGQLGNNDTQNSSSPVLVVGNHSFIQICAQYETMCALKADGSAWAWGYGNNGELGNNAHSKESSPVSVVGNHSFIKIVAGYNHFMALKADGSVWTWGVGGNGALGDNTVAVRSSPVLVVGNHRFIQISGAEFISTALKSDGSVWMWGNNDSGQLGDNTTQNRSSPVMVIGNTFANLYGQMTSYYGAAWSRQQRIIIDHTKVSADETNFPVLLVWTGTASTSNVNPDIINSSSPFSAKPDGSDIRASSDIFGYLPLPVEVVLISKNLNTSLALLEVHVNVPYISSSSDTTFYLWYGNGSATMPDVTDMYGRNAVWAGHTAVWHMTGPGDMTDVTGNGYTAVNTGTTSSTGLYNSASARAFVGSVPQYFTITGLMGSPAASTMLGVINCTGLDTNGAAVVTIGNANNLQIMTATTQGAYYQGTTIWTVSSQTPTLLNAGWAMASYSASPAITSEITYVNGSGGTDTASATAIVYTGAGAGPDTKIGTSALVGDIAWDYTGSMEEIRVLSVTKAASWHTTTYNNLLSANTFIKSNSLIPSTFYKYLGLNRANIKTWNGIPITQIKTWNGLTPG
jgi:alpha-tubulin suppressor-like RCC1 family protein